MGKWIIRFARPLGVFMSGKPPWPDTPRRWRQCPTNLGGIDYVMHAQSIRYWGRNGFVVRPGSAYGFKTEESAAQRAVAIIMKNGSLVGELVVEEADKKVEDAWETRRRNRERKARRSKMPSSSSVRKRLRR